MTNEIMGFVMKINRLDTFCIILGCFVFTACNNDNGRPVFEGDSQQVANQLKPADLIKDVLKPGVKGVDVDYELIPDASATSGAKALADGKYTIRATVTFIEYATDAGTITGGVLIYDIPGQVSRNSFKAIGSCTITTKAELIVETTSGEASVSIADNKASVGSVSVVLSNNNEVESVSVTVSASAEVTVTVEGEPVDVPEETKPVPDPVYLGIDVLGTDVDITSLFGTGVTVEDLQSDVSISTNGTVTGTFYYAEAPLWGVDDEDEGYYLCIAVDVAGDSEVTINDKTVVDDEWVLFLGTDPKNSPKTFSISAEGKSTTLKLSDSCVFIGKLGSESNPIIITEENFSSLTDSTEKLYYKLESDISIAADLKLAEFYGVLDGEGNTIVLTGPGTPGGNLFYSLKDGSVIKNLNIDAGENEKSIAFCTEGTVLLDNVNVSGNFEPTGNNFGPYIIYLGYQPSDGGTRIAADLTIRNCTNKANVIDYSGTKWGFSPFVHAFAMPGVESECTLTLENCVNDADIFGGKVGWVFGNSSDVDKIGKIKIVNCKNGETGSVVGVLDNGDFSWDNKTFRDTDEVDSSFTGMTRKAEVAAITGSADIDSAKITVSSELPASTDSVEFVVGYQVAGYTEKNENPVHKTHYFTLNAENTDNVYSFESLTAIDSEFPGIAGSPETGDFVEIGESSYIYIGNVLDGYYGVVHSCLNGESIEASARTHTASPQFIYIICLDASNNIVGHGTVTIV